jgi:porphobilinogen synthase
VLARRPRRLRASAAHRRLVAETTLQPDHLVLPVFVSDRSKAEPIASMPGVYRHTLDGVRLAAGEAVAAGVGGLMLFGVPTMRDATGSASCDPDGVLNRAIAAVREEVGDALLVMSDLCLDEFTDHGHCGLLDPDGQVDNDATLGAYQDMARAQAEAGADTLGLSGMMDGQVAAVREALDEMDRHDVALLAYTAKYASAFYGPFRDAVGSTLIGDRGTYQMDPRNAREALTEAALDVAEGADILMVKPASAYLDVVRSLREHSTLPIAAYQVSGEYAMIAAAGERGWLDPEAAMLESLVSIRRAGADVVLTYAATTVAHTLRGHR